jgi:hypothetical protein
VKRHIKPNAAFLQAGLLRAEKNKVTTSDVYSVPEGGTALAYVTAPDPTGALLARMKAALAGIEGIEAAIEPPDYVRYGLPLPSDNNQMGALFLVAKDGYAFSGDPSGDVVVDAPAASLGSHGYVATDPDLRSLFIASGRGIRRGVSVASVNAVDVAPTIAHLLGLDLGKVDGVPLTQILETNPASQAR